MMRKKWLLLAAALLLPGMIFIFLKYFGKNEFDVPVLFSGGKITLPAPCVSVPQEDVYRVPRSNAIPFEGLTAVVFTSGLSNESLTDYLFQLGRLRNEFENRPFKLIVVDTAAHDGEEGWVTLRAREYEQERVCSFLLTGDLTAVLVDEQRRIRGQYEPTQQDTERLAVEVEILLKNNLNGKEGAL